MISCKIESFFTSFIKMCLLYLERYRNDRNYWNKNCEIFMGILVLTVCRKLHG